MRTYSIYVFVLILAFAQMIACKKDSGDTGAPPAPPTPNSKQDDLAQVDNAVNAFMTKYNVPGVSVAITKGEKLVYVKGYGFADKEKNEQVTANSLFRLASISKSITGIAVMKLMEAGKLSLDDKVFGTGAILGTQYGTKTYTANIKAITVRHLLQHTSGGWGNSSNDPMFSQPALTAGELIAYTLDNQPQQWAPGTKYDYSNFGYCILGRVIEKITGKTYEEYVKSAILAPIGITKMSIAGNTLADRKTNEVKYYGSTSGGTDPYAFNVTRMDSHGGWIASATDLVKLLVYVDGFNNKKDILKAATITTMTTPPTLATASNYACGWAVNNVNNWWHAGSIPGTYTELVRTASGFNWAILANTRYSGNFDADFDNVIWTAVNNNSTKWQDIDQF